MTTSTHDDHDDAAADRGPVANDTTDDHGQASGHGGHGDGDDSPLGPIDAYAWGAGALGILLGLLVAVCFMLATGDVLG